MKAQQALARGVECLEEARVLLAAGKPNGAVSRAYYAMFHTAEAALLVQLGLEFSSHAAVQAAFGKHFVKTGRLPRRLHRLLTKALEARQEADYELATGFSLEEARARVAEAEEFLTGVRPLIEGDSG